MGWIRDRHMRLSGQEKGRKLVKGLLANGSRRNRSGRSEGEWGGGGPLEEIIG